MKYLFSLFLIVSCGHTTQLTEEAKKVEVFAKKPTDCDVVGKVEGVNKSGSSELALNDARNQAAGLGANGLHVEQEVPNGSKRTIFATAYQCK